MKKIKQFFENALGFFKAVPALFKRSAKEEEPLMENLSEEEREKQKAAQQKELLKAKRTKKGKRVMWFIAALAYSLIYVISLLIKMHFGANDVHMVGDTPVALSTTFLVLAMALVTIDGLMIPAKDERIGFYFLEKYQFSMGPGGIGFRFRLFSLYTANRVKIKLHNVEIPFTARTGGIGSIVYPDRETAATYEGNHLHKQLDISVRIAVEFDIDDPEQFLMKVGTVENAMALFKDNAIEAGRNEIGRKTLAMMDGKFETTAEPMKAKLEAYVEEGAKGEKAGRLGVNIRTYKIIEMEPDATVTAGLSTIAVTEMEVDKAKYKSLAVKHTADGERYRLIEEGVGIASAAEAKGKADAVAIKAAEEARFQPLLAYQKEIATLAGTENGFKSLQLETIKETFKDGKLVLSQEQAGLGNFFSIFNQVQKQGGTP